MSILTPLLAAYGTYGKAKKDAQQQAYENQLQQKQLDATNSYNQQDLELRRSEDADKLRGEGIDPATGKPMPFVVPKALQQVVPGNRGVVDPNNPHATGPSDAQLSDHYFALAAEATKQGLPARAQMYAQQGRDLALNAASFANAAFKAGPDTARAYSQVDLNNARTKAVGTAQQTALQIAGMNNSAKLQVAASNAQAAWNRGVLGAQTREQIAQFQGNARYAVAQLTGAYMLKGKTADEASRLAIDEYNRAYQGYLQQTRPVSGTDLLPPGYASATAPALPGEPTINVNVGAPGAGGMQFQPLPVLPPWAPTPALGTPGAKPGARPNAGLAPNAIPPTTVLQQAMNFLRGGMSAEKVRHNLNDLVNNRRLDAAVARQIETQLGIGGSQAGGNPPL